MSKHIITVRQTLVEQFYLVVDADNYIDAKNIVNESLDCDNENPPAIKHVCDRTGSER